MTEPMHIVVVEDQAADRRIRRALAAGLPSAELVEAASGEGAITALRGRSTSLIVLDDELTTAPAIQTIREIRAAGYTLPILVTTNRDDDIVAELVAAGATDFIQKADITPVRVRRRINHMMRLHEAEAQAATSNEELLRAVASRDELLAIVSHDLRNPLHAVGLAIDELAIPELEPGLRVRYVAAIRRSLGRAGQLISDLLDVSRLEANGLVLQRRPTSVRDILEGTVREHTLLLSEAHMAAHVTMDERIASSLIDVDAPRTHQALGNLVSNAIKYAVGTPAIDLIGRADGDDIELVVADRGPGIDPEIMRHIFDRFFQAQKRRRAGAGLGLAIARGIARAHGGDLTVHLRDGGGTEFRYRVAAASPPG